MHKQNFIENVSIDKDTFEIVIADLDKDPAVDLLIRNYRDKLNIKHLKIDYDGVFWKSKALNHCASQTEGRYITMLDIDAFDRITVANNKFIAEDTAGCDEAIRTMA